MMNNEKALDSVSDADFSLVLFVRLFRARWRLIAAGFLLGAIIAAGVSYTMPPIFTADVSLLPRQEEGNSNIIGQLASLTNLSLSSGTAYEELYGRIITSDRILDAVLDKQWKTKESEESQDLYTILEYGDKNTTHDRLEREKFKKYLRKNVIIFDRRNTTGFMSISVSLPHQPVLAADLANELADQLDGYLQQLSRTRASDQRRFISTRLGQVEQDVASAASLLAEFESKNHLYQTSPTLRSAHSGLERSLEVQTAIWIELKRQYEIAKIDEFKDTAAVEVLDSAIPPNLRSAPRRKMIVLTGAALGFIIGCMVILVLDRKTLAEHMKL